MAIHKLDLDYEDALDPYALLAIHCTQADYRMGYLLNRKLGISLRRCKEDLEVFYNHQPVRFALFEFEDDTQYTQIHLVSNSGEGMVPDQNPNAQDLFGSLSTPSNRKYHLLPEFKQADYFLKISSSKNNANENVIVSRINEIAQVITAYVVDLPLVKSKSNLIFE